MPGCCRSRGQGCCHGSHGRLQRWSCASTAAERPFGLDCGFPGNHPNQSKHSAHLTGRIKAFLTSLTQAGSVRRRSRVQAGTKVPSWGGDAPMTHHTEVSLGRWAENPPQHHKLCHFLVNTKFPRVLLTYFHSDSSGKHCQGLISTECRESEGHIFPSFLFFCDLLFGCLFFFFFSSLSLLVCVWQQLL